MATLGSLIVQIGANLDPLKKGLKTSGKLVGSAAKTIGGGLALGAAGGVAALGAGLGIVGTKAFTMATDIEAATGQIQAALGLTAEDAQQLAAIGQDVFANNFTSSVGEATAAVATAALQMKSLEFGDLQSATESGLKLADAFGTDLGSALNAANVLMDQFGVTQTEAFDFLSGGFQRGLDTSGDFLDSITEYGNLFGQSGASASQFFSLMESGLQGGVLGTDKAADAFKEFQIRFLEGTDEVKAATAILTGDDWPMFIDEMQTGHTTVADMFDTLVTGLSEVSDPIKQNALGVALFGTQFEDLGASAVLGINTAATSMADLEGSTALLDSQYDTLSAKFETIKRQATTALAPIGDQMLSLAESALPKLTELSSFLVENIVPAVTQAFDAMKLGFAFFQENETFGRIAQAFVDIGTSLGLIEEGSEPAGVAMDAFAALMGTLETGVKAGVLVVEGIAVTMEAIATATDAVVTAIGKFTSALSGITYPAVLDKISGGFGAIGSWWAGDGEGIENVTKHSPVPFAEGLKEVGRAGRALPDIGARLAPVGNVGTPGGDDTGGTGGAAANQTINLVVDGKILASIVSGQQGIFRQNRATMGGATRL